MKTPKPRKRRLHYQAHSDLEVRRAVKAMLQSHAIISDWLLERVCEDVTGASDFDRGVAEGRRRLAQEMIGMELDETINVKSTTIEDKDAIATGDYFLNS
jgi:hypothetical protein